MKYSNLILFILIVFGSMFGQAQSFNATASQTRIGMNQSVQVDFTAEGSNVTDFKAPVFAAFTVLSGPSQSFMTSNINGVVTENVTYTYLLQPITKGKLTIGEASVKIKGRVYKSSPITIEVTDAVQNQGNQRTNPNRQKNQQPQQQTNVRDIKDNLLVIANVSNPNPYQGQQIILTYKFYYNVQISQYQRPTPKLDAFWVQQENIPQNPATTSEVYNGKKYYVATIYKSYIFPQKDGEIAIDPLKIETLVRVKSQRSSPFDDFFNNPFFDNPFDYEDIKYTITSNALKIWVKPFPGGKPDGFKGITGNYTFLVTTDKTRTKTNDPVTLKIMLSGQGNIKLIEPFDLDLSSDIETFEPKVKENISTTNDVVSGSKVFEYLLVPHKEGIYKIPSLSFSFFDPYRGRYFTLNSNEINITVDKGSGTIYSGLPAGVDQKDIEFRGKDIQYIRLTPGTFTLLNKRYFLSLKFFLLLVLPLVLFVVFLVFKRKSERDNLNIDLMKSRKALSFARKQLKLAGKMLKENKPEEFYLAITTACNKYIADKAGIPFAELSKEKIREELEKKNISEDTITGFIEHLENCEFARYAPAHSSMSLKEMYDKSVELLSSIEKHIR